MIDSNEFDSTLRRLIYAEPFVPFYAELADGRKIWIRQPVLVIGNGRASLIDSDDGALVSFTHDEVVGFHQTGQGVMV